MSATAKRLRRLCMTAIAASCLAAPAAQAFTVNIAPGARMLYLQVGRGTITFTTWFFGLRVPNPSDNNTVNEVTVTVPANAVAAGTPVPMQGNANVTNSPESGDPICPANTDVFIAGLYRAGWFSGNTAVLNVNTPPWLTDGANTIPFTEIEWVSVGVNDNNPTIPDGQFSGQPVQRLATIPANTWFEGCLRFRFRNSQPYPAGTFRGPAVYTLTAP